MPALSDILQFMRGQLFQMPVLPNVDFAGKVVIVTGGNSGLGFECAKQLIPSIRLNVSTLILGCRSLSKGESAKAILLSDQPPKLPPPDIRVWEIDMTDYASVKSFSRRINSELTHVHALLANAGISTNEFHLAEGLEQTLTVNVTSTFLLALVCLPALQSTAHQTQQPTHLCITGSNVHAFADPKALLVAPEGQVFTSLSDERSADMSGRYFLSKLLVMLCVRELSARLRSPHASSSRVIVNCPNPGWCRTPLFRQDDGGFWGRNMLRLIGRSAEEGARCLTSAIAAGEESHGEYLSEGRVKRASVWARGEEGKLVQGRVWGELVRILDRVEPGVGGGL